MCSLVQPYPTEPRYGLPKSAEEDDQAENGTKSIDAKRIFKSECEAKIVVVTLGQYSRKI